ncbi:MAG: hypothetical protein R2699_07415 [Acidimicrobiales bacterium]
MLDAVSTGMPSGRHDGGISAEDEPNDDWDDDWDDDLEPGAIALPLRAVVPLDDGTFYVNLPPVFRSVLHQAVDDLRHRIVMGDDSTLTVPDGLPRRPRTRRRVPTPDGRRAAPVALRCARRRDRVTRQRGARCRPGQCLAPGDECVAPGVRHRARCRPRRVGARRGRSALALYDLYTYLGYLVGSIIDALRHDDGTT